MENLDVLISTIKIKMTDGIMLDADIINSSEIQLKPILLCRTPYPKEIIYSEFNLIRLAKDGWFIVIQNVRGRYKSEGSFLPFIQEREDTNDTIKYLKNLEGTNGQITIFGTSYCGWIALLGSQENSINVCSILTGSDIKNGWFYEGGIFRKAFAQSWGLSFSFTTGKPSKLEQYLADNLLKLYKNVSNEKKLEKLFVPYKNWRDYENKMWDQIILRFSAKNNYFFISGWYDIFLENMIQDYLYLKNTVNAENLVMIIGPWSHNTLFSQVVGETDFGLEASINFKGILDEMFDWMKNTNDLSLRKSYVKVFIMGKNVWKNFTNWPPNTIYKKYFLKESLHKKTLSEKMENINDNNSFILTHTKKSIKYTYGGRTLDPFLKGMSGPRKSVYKNSQSGIVFLSELIKSPLIVCGMMYISLIVSFVYEYYDLNFRIIINYSNGSSINLIDKTYRIYPKIGENKIHLPIGNIAYEFPKNSKIGLYISTSNWPHVDSNPDTINKKKCEISFNSRHSFIEIPILEA